MATMLVSVFGSWRLQLPNLAIADRLTGISLGQGFAYVQWFPCERRLLKVVVSFVSDA